MSEKAPTTEKVATETKEAPKAAAEKRKKKGAPPGGFARKKNADGEIPEKAKPESRSKRANIIFPVSRIDRLLREGRYAPRIEATAPVYLAAVLEYLVFEILELAHNICQTQKKTRIIPQHINWAVGHDQELNTLFQGVTIANGGVIPTTQNEKKPAKSGGSTKKSTKKSSSAEPTSSMTY
eukprot:gene9028-11060_t